MKKLIYSAAFMLFIASGISAQQTIKSVSVAVMNESISFPPTRFSSIHPGVEIGMTLKQKDKGKTTRQINLVAGFYNHKKMDNAFYIKPEYLLAYKIKDIISLDIAFGAGYMHTFFPGDIYEQDSEGAYYKTRQFGRSHLLAGAGIGISLNNEGRFSPFIRQDINIQTPFANGIPVMIHSMLKTGINIKIQNNE